MRIRANGNISIDLLNVKCCQMFFLLKTWNLRIKTQLSSKENISKIFSLWNVKYYQTSFCTNFEFKKISFKNILLICEILNIVKCYSCANIRIRGKPPSKENILDLSVWTCCQMFYITQKKKPWKKTPEKEI